MFYVSLVALKTLFYNKEAFEKSALISCLCKYPFFKEISSVAIFIMSSIVFFNN